MPEFGIGTAPPACNAIAGRTPASIQTGDTMLSDGYEIICNSFADLRRAFGLSSAEEVDVKQFCDHQITDGELLANPSPGDMTAVRAEPHD